MRGRFSNAASLCFSVVAILCCGGLARADSVSFDLAVSDLGNAYSGPFATATITLVNSTTATVSFVGESDGTYTYLFIDGGSVALNVNAPVADIGVSNITTTAYPGGGFGTPNYSPALIQANQGEDGFGKFNVTLNNHAPAGGNGSADAVEGISFTLTNSAGWTDAASVLTPNNTAPNEYFVAAHFAVFPDNNVTIGGGNTAGYAADTGMIESTPLPSVVCAGLGLMGLVGLRRGARTARAARG